MPSPGTLSASWFPGRGFFTLWIVLFAVWMVANATLAMEVALTGAVISFVLAYWFAHGSDAWRQVSWTPRGAYHFLAYTGTFVVEMVKANINMLGYVYSPRLAIKPGIIRIRTRLKSPIGRLALANSIALTPGSLILDIRDDTLFVHWLDLQNLDVDRATETIAGPFERHLEKVFG
jgi:multicomponent Na+:H+ antiporter subunit E